MRTREKFAQFLLEDVPHSLDQLSRVHPDENRAFFYVVSKNHRLAHGLRRPVADLPALLPELGVAKLDPASPRAANQIS